MHSHNGGLRAHQILKILRCVAQDGLLLRRSQPLINASKDRGNKRLPGLIYHPLRLQRHSVAGVFDACAGVAKCIGASRLIDLGAWLGFPGQA